MEYYINTEDIAWEERTFKSLEEAERRTEKAVKELLKFPEMKFKMIHKNKVFFTIELKEDHFAFICGEDLTKAKDREDFLDNLGTHLPVEYSLVYGVSSFLKQKPYIVEKTSGIKKKSRFGRSFKKACYLQVGENLKQYKYLKPNKGTGSKHEHRYDVAGHWRKVNGLGKDQHGNYNQVNRTWVRNCIKGSGEYVYKPRVVRSS